MKKYKITIHRIKLCIASFSMRLRRQKKHVAKWIAFNLILALVMGRIATYHVSGAGIGEIPMLGINEVVNVNENEEITLNKNEEITVNKKETSTEVASKHQNKVEKESEESTDKNNKKDVLKFEKKELKIYPEGRKTNKKVILNGNMPENASAKVMDVADKYTNKKGYTNLSKKNPKASLIAAYDISILNDKKEYQPDKDNPIKVDISNPKLKDASKIEIWHIKDDGIKEKIKNYKIKDGTVSFDATGFSVYAVVDLSEPYNVEEISGINDLESNRATAGFCMYYGGSMFFTQALNENGALIESNNPANAARWFFTKAGNYYKISTIVNGFEKFIHTRSGNEIELSDSADLFQITSAGNNSYYIKNSIENKWIQHSGSGSGIRYYQANTNATNSKIKIVFADTMEIPEDYYNINGKSFGIMSYPGGTEGLAFMTDENENYLSMLALSVRRDAGSKTLYVAEDSDITMWKFHYVSDMDYMISATVNGETKFLKIGNTLTLVEENQASIITVTTDTKEHIKLSSNGKTLTLGDNGFITTTTSSDNSRQWLHLVELSNLTEEDYVTYYADKVSISEVPDGATVIVYTRVWNPETTKYDFYAIDHDGTLYPCYERGDSLVWIGSRINTLLWDFTEYHYDDGTPNYYYELYNNYSKKFIAPQLEGNQVLSDTKIGINLPGRKFGEYYSEILAWDTPYYAYAGLMSDIDNYRTTTGPKADADSFYFAIVQNPTHLLTEVNTIDNNDYGIQMKMIDFPEQPDSSGHYYQNDFIGVNGDFNTTATQGILTNYIDSTTGYPNVSFSGASLGQLYSGATEVNHLFLDSTYQDSGYFEFDSSQNFATLIQPNGSVGSDFTVYRELGTTDTNDRSTLKHGQFLPYNTITAGVYSVKNPENIYGPLAQFGNPNVGILPESDPRKYEKLHVVNGKTNYYNGMELSASMVKTPSGKDSWGHDIVFEFTGDDDFWFYVDNELVIDLGGIHSALEGTVNFATGKVVVDGVETNLRAIFKKNYEERNPQATPAEVNAFLAEYFDEDEIVFKDYSTHTMKVYYMERGAGASNLHMRFNLTPVIPGNVILTKKVTGSNDIDFNLVEYPFQIWYKDEENGEPHLLTNEQFITVNYQNSIQRVDYEPSYTPFNSSVTYNSVYFLNPGKSAEIKFPVNTIQYKIVECGINGEVYDTVKVNDSVIAGSTITGTDRKSYDSGWLSVAERPVIMFDNHVNSQTLRTISFQKKLFDEHGDELSREEDNTVFSFRLYLSNGTDDNLELANMAKYYVTDPHGKLCTWNQQTQSFEVTNNTDYSALTTEQKAQFTFETSMNGAISKIPAGYIVEVPNVPVGTKFKVVERENEVPKGYSFDSYERVGGSYHAEDGDTLNSGWVRANESPKMIINNKRGWSLEVNKEWSDKEFSTSHDPVYLAVYNGNTLVPGTVCCLAHPTTTKQYFFEDLMAGADFEDYKVYEVELTNPVVNSEGQLVSYDGIRKRLSEGDDTVINAVTNNSNTSAPYTYSVSYEYGTAHPQSGGTSQVENVREDTVKNTRTGGVVLTLYDMNTNETLPGGEFTLKEGNITLGTYTSDGEGRITVLYDFDKNANYTLTQTKTPAGYIKLPNPVVFSIGNDNSVTISGNEPQWQNGRKSEVPGDSLVAYINVYNKPYVLSALKVDGSTDTVLSGAHFALYRSVQGLGGPVKDLNPIPGYEDLVSDVNGVIPRVDNTLAPGKYYLTELSAPSSYDIHQEDIVFIISEDGNIRIEGAEHEDHLVITGNTQCNYTLHVPNFKNEPVELVLTKTVTGSFGDKNKQFTFKLEVENADEEEEYSWSKNNVNQSEPMHPGASFTMGHGDVVKIMIPVNSRVTVTEDNKDYLTRFVFNNTGVSVGNTETFLLARNSTLAVTNNLDAVIPVGVFNVTAGMVVVIAIGCVSVIFRKRRKKRSY